jgi:hypothetical protein
MANQLEGAPLTFLCAGNGAYDDSKVRRIAVGANSTDFDAGSYQYAGHQ